MPRLKIDLHVHTNHSDSTSSVKKILEAARERGLDGIAVTDHSMINACAEASTSAPDLVIIPGVEVETDEGHVLVLGVKNPPPKGTSIDEVVEYAEQEGGVIVIPHPSLPFISVREEVIERIRPDAIETYNAKMPLSWYFMRKNMELANRLGIPQTGGSDAHSHNSVGDMYTVVDAGSRTVKAVLDAIRRGRIRPEGKASSFGEKVRMVVRIILRKRTWRP